MSDATIQIHGERACAALNFLVNLWNFFCYSKHENLLTGKQRYEIGPCSMQQHPSVVQLCEAALTPFNNCLDTLLNVTTSISCPTMWSLPSATRSINKNKRSFILCSLQQDPTDFCIHCILCSIFRFKCYWAGKIPTVKQKIRSMQAWYLTFENKKEILLTTRVYLHMYRLW